jgi:hypothetical protein
MNDGDRPVTMHARCTSATPMPSQDANMLRLSRPAGSGDAEQPLDFSDFTISAGEEQRSHAKFAGCR